MKLKPGVHLILATNDKGGASKSTACAEVRVACNLEGIPCRLLTFDRSNDTLSQIFRGVGVTPLAKPNGDVLLDTFGQQIDLARNNGEVIIADMPPGITDKDKTVMQAFADSHILEEFATIGLIIPVMPHKDHIKGALDALSVYADVPVPYTHGLIRAWRPEPTSPDWSNFEAWKALTEKFAVWNCTPYMQSMSDMMQGQAPFHEYPGLDMLPKYFVDEGPKLSTRERGQLRSAVVHLEAARNAIKTHLLARILEPSKTK